MRSFVDPRVDFHVLTGYLGSGKTTVLRHYLDRTPADETAVIINEYGAVSLDHRFVMHAAPVVDVVAGGCLCCAPSGQLKDAVVRVLVQRVAKRLPGLRRIVLETSGLANPASIVATVLDDFVLKDYVRMASCVAAVDATDAIECARAQPDILAQIAAADRVVVTKLDLVAPGRAREIRDFVASVNPACDIVESPHGAAVAAVFDPVPPSRRGPVPGPAASHLDRAASHTLRIDEDIDWPAFSVWLTALLNRHGSRILRFKSLLRMAGDDTPTAIHGVRHRMYPPEHLPPGTPAPPGSELVFITDGLPGAEIEASLQRFLRYARAKAA